MKFSIEKIKLSMKVNWSISRNSSFYKENFILTLSDDQHEVKSEIAPNVRYDESEQRVYKEFELAKKELEKSSLETKLDSSFSHSFSFGFNMLLLQMKCKKENIDLYQKFSITPKSIQTSISIPIMPQDMLEDYIASIKEFQILKIKVNKDNAISFTQKIHNLCPDKKLRIDANEAFENLESYLEFEKTIKDYPIEFIEQPFKAKDVDLYKKLKPISKFSLIADESVESNPDFDELEKCFDGINVKLMKSSSFENAYQMIQKAKSRGMKTMIGCMIETSLGISHAMPLAAIVDYCDLDGHLLIKDEPFRKIIRKGSILNLA